jgi:vacuolar-type H+-ATPase subunit H
MEEEKTLLQQIRDKEQEFSKKIEAVKQETDMQIAAARVEREATIRDAGRSGKITAEEVYRKEMQKTETEIEQMKKASVIETGDARVKGEKNLQPAVEKIVGYVAMEQSDSTP